MAHSLRWQEQHYRRRPICRNEKARTPGYTLIQVKSREEALEWTRRFPNPAVDGGKDEIEVRQLFELEDFEQSEAVERFRKMDTDDRE